MIFLMQLEPYEEYAVLADTLPNCVEIGESPLPPEKGEWDLDYLELFLGNGLYLFGTDDPNAIYVYAVIQR